MTPKVGMRFRHAYWSYQNGDPQLCQITRIAQGTVYYRDVHEDGTLGSRWKFAIDKFSHYCKEVMKPGRD